MQRFNLWQSVKVSNEANPRFGQAGTVFGYSPEHPDQTAVKFDSDNAVLALDNADLQAL